MTRMMSSCLHSLKHTETRVSEEEEEQPWEEEEREEEQEVISPLVFYSSVPPFVVMRHFDLHPAAHSHL